MLLPLSLLLAALAANATPTAKSAPARTITIHLVESGGKAPRAEVTLALPVDGSLDAWVQGGDDARFCRARADRIESTGALSIELSCRHTPKGTDDLRLSARRSLTVGKTVVLGEIHRADGRTVEVRGTLK